MSIAVPATNLLMLAAFAGYLLWLNPLLAAVTFSVYPAVLLLVPVLQKRVDLYNKKRVDAGRKLSGKIGESVAGIHEIQAHGAFTKKDVPFNIGFVSQTPFRFDGTIEEKLLDNKFFMNQHGILRELVEGKM